MKGDLRTPAVAVAPAQAASSEDTVLGGRVCLRQPLTGLRAAIDPIFLAAAVPADAGDSVLDLGCGMGVAALCLLARQPKLSVTGLEIQADLVRLAAENGRLNSVADRFLPILGDVLHPPPRLAPGSFHHVMCNPPHQDPAVSAISPSPSREAAMREGSATLTDWIATALAMVRSKGSISLVHRADRLEAVLAALAGRAGEIVIVPLWPGADKPAKRIIVRARKGVATPTRLGPGITLHDLVGGFTAAADAVLRDAAGLDL